MTHPLPPQKNLSFEEADAYLKEVTAAETQELGRFFRSRKNTLLRFT